MREGLCPRVAFRDFKKDAAVTNINFFRSDAEEAILKRFRGRAVSPNSRTFPERALKTEDRYGIPAMDPWP